jgi:xanthine dehydrogenase molybdopterin-binding subunit B
MPAHGRRENGKGNAIEPPGGLGGVAAEVQNPSKLRLDGTDDLLITGKRRLPTTTVG